MSSGVCIRRGQSLDFYGNKFLGPSEIKLPAPGFVKAVLSFRLRNIGARRDQKGKGFLGCGFGFQGIAFARESSFSISLAMAETTGTTTALPNWR